MKTITMYELIVLVKEGKAPNKIKFNGLIWEYVEYQYQRIDKRDLGNIWNDYNFNVLNCEVEIIEEEKKISDKWNDLSFTTMRKREDSIDDDIHKLKGYIETIMRTQNEVIDYLKSKGE